MERIEIPAQRMQRVLALLGMTPQDEVVELVILPDGGMIRRYKKDKQGRKLPYERRGSEGWQTETLELVFVNSGPDPMFSSTAHRREDR